MTTCEQGPISLSSPAELIEAVPYLLGFHPHESLVVLGLRCGGVGPPSQIAVSARSDLDLTEEAGLDLAMAASLVRILGDADCAAVGVVIFSDRCQGADPRADPELARVTMNLSQLLGAGGIDVLDLLLVDQTHWWSLICQRWQCCPPEGNPRLADSALAAEFTYAGLVAHSSRASLMATLNGRPEPLRVRLLPALHRADQRLSDLLDRKGPQRARRTETAALVRAGYEAQHGANLSNRRLTRLGAALRDLAIRDQLWLGIDRRTVTVISLLEQLHSALPAPYDAAPMFLFGWASWRNGAGALAMEAAERALRSDPSYSAAQLLIDAVQSGLDPHATPNLLGPPN